jgi:ABC-type antimicrobial peptide transport system permease subunit
MALGAQRYQIYSMLLKSTGGLVGAGLLLRGLLSIPFNGWMKTLLGGTEGFSPIVLVGTAILLGGVAFIATLIPSHRAASIDPMKALRAE